MKKLPVYLLLLATLSLQAREYYVDTNADPGGNGSRRRPFRTIQQAADRMQPGDVCLIAPGIYPESVRPVRSGEPGSPITFQAWSPGERVSVTGADPVPGSAWETVGENIYRARLTLKLDHENQVFLADQMLLEARWPNSGHVLLEPTLAVMKEGTTPDRIEDPDIPDRDWSGASVWIHAPKYWADWTTVITGFREGVLEIENVAPYPGPKRHVAAPGADFFIYGAMAALDAANEWFYDEQEEYLYVFRPGGELPAEPYFVKHRMNAFDLSGLSHIRLTGVEIRASTVDTDEKSSHLVLDDLKILHPYHSSEANRYYGTQTDKGVRMMGSHCEIRNCEIAYSSGCGVVLGGRYNLVYNCHIHDTDYIGTYASSVLLRGEGNIISHCTMNRTGRSLIDYGGMYKSLIQFCNMFHSGMLTSDTGLTYGNVIEGGGSEIRYNWMHDNLDTHLDMGLYYDHGTQNIYSHHNVIWGVSYSGFHINHYGYYHLAYHNTFTSGRSGFTSRWGNQYAPDLHGCRFYNNVFSAASHTSAGNYDWGPNLQQYGELEELRYLPQGSPAIDAGTVLPGINDGYTGAAPDLGAYEYGGQDWEPGHCFENPPGLDTTRSKPLHRNRLKNSAFEYNDHIRPWETNGSAEVVTGSKNHTTPDTARIRMGSASMKLGEDGVVTQRVTGLEPGSWYEFAAFVRADRNGRAAAVAELEDGSVFESPHAANTSREWYLLKVRFRTGPAQREVKVSVRSKSERGGNVFVDDCGLVYLKKEG